MRLFSLSHVFSGNNLRDIRFEEAGHLTTFCFPCGKYGTQTVLHFRVDVTRNKLRSDLRSCLIFQREFYCRIRSGQGDITGQIRQRLNVGITDQRLALHILTGRYPVTYRISTVGVLLAGFQVLFLTNLTGSELCNLMAGRTEKGTGVHDVKQRGSRFLTVDIFQLGIGLDTKHITATELTGFRQDLHQVRQFV